MVGRALWEAVFVVQSLVLLAGVVSENPGAATSNVPAKLAAITAKGATLEKMELRMKGVKVSQHDQYSCHQYTAPGTGDSNKAFAVAFEALPEAFGGRVHHMLVFGCDGEKNYDENFQCGMSAGPCRGLPRQTFLFGWAKDAPGIGLPDKVGFAIGPNAHVRTIVIQVHYANPLPDTDSSGVLMHYTTTPELADIQNYANVVAGVAASKLVIPPRVPKQPVPVTCAYTGTEPLNVFAYRVHSHDLSIGLPTTWEMKRKGESQFSLVTERDPGLPQVFFPLAEAVAINPGDTWRLTCNYNSMERTQTTRVGPTNKHEMCNLYLMYYASEDMAWQCVDDRLTNLQPSNRKPRMVNQMGGTPLRGSGFPAVAASARPTG